jgi:hypothetical protein
VQARRSAFIPTPVGGVHGTGSVDGAEYIKVFLFGFNAEWGQPVGLTIFSAFGLSIPALWHVFTHPISDRCIHGSKAWIGTTFDDTLRPTARNSSTRKTHDTLTLTSLQRYVKPPAHARCYHVFLSPFLSERFLSPSPSHQPTVPLRMLLVTQCSETSSMVKKSSTYARLLLLQGSRTRAREYSATSGRIKHFIHVQTRTGRRVDENGMIRSQVTARMTEARGDVPCRSEAVKAASVKAVLWRC